MTRGAGPSWRRRGSSAFQIRWTSPRFARWATRLAAARRAARAYSGKLEINKGADLLVPAAVAARLTCPLVVVGDGKLRSRVAGQARNAGLDVRMLGWLPRNEALSWVRHATALVFPSRGPESLSRVLLEAGALGVPMAAMDTGGTGDIV